MDHRLRAHAELVRRLANELHGADVGYDEDGVHWLSSHLDQLRSTVARHMYDELIDAYGAYLGECMCHSLGGEWQRDPVLGLTVALNDGRVLSPHAQVAAQLRDAQAPSILAAYIDLPDASELSVTPF